MCGSGCPDKAKGRVHAQVRAVKGVPLDICTPWGLSVSFSVYTVAWEGPTWGLGVNMSVHTEGNWLQTRKEPPPHCSLCSQVGNIPKLSVSVAVIRRDRETQPDSASLGGGSSV